MPAHTTPWMNWASAHRVDVVKHPVLQAALKRFAAAA